MAITFPRTGPVFTTRDTVAFYAYVDDGSVLCEITAEALCTCFDARGLSAVALIRAFEDNRELIERAAAEGLTGIRDPQQPLLLAASNFAKAVSG